MSSESSRRFNVIIIGAGLAGLGAAISLARKGNRVTVLEADPALNEIGAGIQIPPSSSRILDSYGLTSAFHEKVVWPKEIRFLRYETGETIGSTDLHPKMTERYGFPYWVIHRADFQRVLYEGAKSAGATIRFSTRVNLINQEIPAVTLADGQVLEADLIVGADGNRSITRKAVLPDQEVKAELSSSCAYRAIIPATVMNSDKSIAHLMQEVVANCWIGPLRHIMAYPIRNGTMYNLVMSHPNKVIAGKSSELGNLGEMRDQFMAFDSVIRKVLTHVESCLKWQLATLPSLKNWVSDSGRVVIIGDAAHAMVPFLAQGAATAIEDGATLGECLERASSARDIPKVLQAFQTIRKPRCEIIQDSAKFNGNVWHLPDGEEQQRRDQAMKHDIVDQLSDSRAQERNPNLWSDSQFQPWLFGHNAIEHANKMLNELLGSSHNS